MVAAAYIELRKYLYPMLFLSNFFSLRGLSAFWQGFRLAWRRLNGFRHYRASSLPVAHANYFSSGMATLQYPYDRLPVPWHGRYKLNNAIEDCIVCDRCANVCPVDCIDIEATSLSSPFRQTSNGMMKRLHAIRFDIDMAKCCFCGLCTTVCPTKCLTVTADYDYSVFDWLEHKVSFAVTLPEKSTV